MSFGVGLTASMQKALKEGVPVFLVGAIDHPDGMVRAWSGIGDLIWNGETFYGKGDLGGITQVSQSQELEIQDRTIYLRGVNPDQLAFVTSNVRNRIATFWLACVRAGNKIVRDPVLLDEMEMDGQSFPVDERGNAMIKITAFSGLWTLERAQNVAWSPEEAKRAYPEETGFDMIPTLQNREVLWKRVP